MAQIFPSRIFNALAHVIPTKYTHIHYTHMQKKKKTWKKQQQKKPMVHLDLWEWLLKKESLELGLKLREGGQIPQTGRQQIPDRWGEQTERMAADRFEIAFSILLKDCRGCEIWCVQREAER